MRSEKSKRIQCFAADRNKGRSSFGIPSRKQPLLFSVYGRCHDGDHFSGMPWFCINLTGHFKHVSMLIECISENISNVIWKNQWNLIRNYPSLLLERFDKTNLRACLYNNHANVLLLIILFK